MKKVLYSLLFLSFMVGAPMQSQAQCKSFTKKTCLPHLEPYVYNGQLNSAVLSEGDVAELLLTFYGGQDYRINICSHETLGKIQFQVYDTDKNLLFDNTNNELTNSWDFKSNSTQQLIVRVTVPEEKNRSGMVQNGCVSILVGFKE